MVATQAQRQDGTLILCSCCPAGRRQKFGLLPTQEGIVLRDGRHGRTHTVMMRPLELLQRLAGTMDGSAIQQYVAEVTG